MNIRTVLFDVDGTLLDTSEGIIESVQHTIRALRLQPLSKAGLLSFIGPPIQQSLTRHFNLDAQQVQQAADIFRDYYKSKALFKATPYSGIHDLLESLSRHGLQIGVATFKREDYAIELLRHFGLAPLCQVIHGADNLNQMTKSDIINLCIDQFHCPPADVCYVGDTENDMLSARKSGTHFVGVTWGFGFRPHTSLPDGPLLTDNIAQLSAALGLHDNPTLPPQLRD